MRVYYRHFGDSEPINDISAAFTMDGVPRKGDTVTLDDDEFGEVYEVLTTTWAPRVIRTGEPPVWVPIMTLSKEGL